MSIFIKWTLLLGYSFFLLKNSMYLYLLYKTIRDLFKLQKIITKH